MRYIDEIYVKINKQLIAIIVDIIIEEDAWFLDWNCQIKMKSRYCFSAIIYFYYSSLLLLLSSNRQHWLYLQKYALELYTIVN